MIKTEFDKNLDLTTFSCRGPVTAAEIEDQLRLLYEGTPSLHALWDFSGGEISALSPGDIQGIAAFVKKTSHSRAGGRTALVFPPAMLTELAPLLESIAEIKVPDAKIKIFNELAAGLDWIKA